METYLSRQRTRCDVVCAAESREEVVQSNLIGEIDCRHPEAHPVGISLEQVVFAK